MAPFIDGWLEGPTRHERKVAEACAGRVEEIEKEVASLKAKLDGERLSKGRKEKLRVDIEMAQSELEFWRAKRARISGSSRHEGRAGYWLVPREPSQRALRIAHGMTDLADISCSPRNMASTLKEIALAVRIVLEEDGVPVLQEDGLPSARDEVQPDVRAEEAKETLMRLSDTELELIKTTARYHELREGIRDALGGLKKAEDVLAADEELDGRMGGSPIQGPLAASVAEWRKLLAR